MEAVAKQITGLEKHYADPAWVAEHNSELHEYIEEGLKNSSVPDSVWDALLLVYPQVIQQEDLKRWNKLANRALKIIQDSKPYVPEDGQRSEHLINDAYVIKRLNHMKNVRQAGRRRRRVRINPRELYETYLILLMTLSFQKRITLTPQRIEDTLAFARAVNHTHIYHKTYQAVAYIFNMIGKYERALLYSNLAFSYFDKIDDTLEKALSGIAIADALNGLGHHENASEWKTDSVNLLQETPYAGKINVIATGD